MSYESGIGRRSFLASLGAAAGGAISLNLLDASTPGGGDIQLTTSKPNILMIMVDELRYQELGAALPGLSAVLPNITRLQGQAVEFTNFYTCAASCTPSRAAFLTGLYPTQTAMYVTQGGAAAPNLATGFPTFGTYLESQGYNCSWFGKWHCSDDSPDFLNGLAAYGFSQGAPPLLPSPNGYPNEGVTGGTATDGHAASANYLNDQEIVAQYAAAIQSLCTGGKPWFAAVSLVNPHDIASYPLYLLQSCGVNGAGQDPRISFAPVQPGTAGTPALQPLFNTTAPASQTCNVAWYIPASVSNASAWPANVQADPANTKPYLQAIYQNDIAVVNGAVGANQDPNNANGDWGAFLNTYYWLVSCVDKLLGNLSTPDAPGTTTPTVLGQLALQASLGNLNLNNTVILFTSDHGEYGGAHLLQGKNAAAYEEAIRVPLFVHLPGLGSNYKRTQMASSVDVFGLLAALATNNGNWRGDNPQLAGREDLYSFLKSNNNRNAYRILSSGDASFNSQPYVMHTTNEFFADKKKPGLNFNTENYHVVSLRTGNGTQGPQKLVYYYGWGAGRYRFDNSAAPPPPQQGVIVSEWYDLLRDPGERSNLYASISASANQTFLGVIGSELQAPLPVVNGVNLATLLATAGQNWLTYLTTPGPLTVTPSSVSASDNPQTITVTANPPGSILPGSTISLALPNQPPSQFVNILDTLTPPFQVQFTFKIVGSYTLNLQNACGASASVTIVAS